jgi:glycosyltransferase involved in cell wall biosynthesis
MPFFSICIPAYKNIDFLKRLLDSVLIQSFTDFEIIITDDSPDDSILNFLTSSKIINKVSYFKNLISLGTPENWNEGIRHAKGDWIKIMHDDDWFDSEHALQVFYDHAKNAKTNFIFSAYFNIYINKNNKRELITCPESRYKRVLKFPANLYSKNIIGPPSVILVKNCDIQLYDNQMKWLVDIDYYIRILNKIQPLYIHQPLICVGMSNVQVTTYTHNKPAIEIPEGLILLSKVGEQAFDHVLYFDAWWRLLRNLSIRGLNQFSQYSENAVVPSRLIKIIKFQKFIPLWVLKFGVFSKPLMFTCFVINKAISK